MYLRYLRIYADKLYLTLNLKSCRNWTNQMSYLMVRYYAMRSYANLTVNYYCYGSMSYENLNCVNWTVSLTSESLSYASLTANLTNDYSNSNGYYCCGLMNYETNFLNWRCYGLNLNDYCSNVNSILNYWNYDLMNYETKNLSANYLNENYSNDWTNYEKSLNYEMSLNDLKILNLTNYGYSNCDLSYLSVNYLNGYCYCANSKMNDYWNCANYCYGSNWN